MSYESIFTNIIFFIAFLLWAVLFVNILLFGTFIKELKQKFLYEICKMSLYVTENVEEDERLLASACKLKDMYNPSFIKTHFLTPAQISSLKGARRFLISQLVKTIKCDRGCIPPSSYIELIKVEFSDEKVKQLEKQFYGKAKMYNNVLFVIILIMACIKFIPLILN